MEAEPSSKILVNIRPYTIISEKTVIYILTRTAYFSSIFINIKFQDYALSSVIVEAAMLVLLMVGN
jgi:hypothetical protein